MANFAKNFLRFFANFAKIFREFSRAILGPLLGSNREFFTIFCEIFRTIFSFFFIFSFSSFLSPLSPYFPSSLFPLFSFFYLFYKISPTDQGDFVLAVLIGHFGHSCSNFCKNLSRKACKWPF